MLTIFIRSLLAHKPCRSIYWWSKCDLLSYFCLGFSYLDTVDGFCNRYYRIVGRRLHSVFRPLKLLHFIQSLSVKFPCAIPGGRPFLSRFGHDGVESCYGMTKSHLKIVKHEQPLQETDHLNLDSLECLSLHKSLKRGTTFSAGGFL